MAGIHPHLIAGGIREAMKTVKTKAWPAIVPAYWPNTDQPVRVVSISSASEPSAELPL